VKYSLNKLSEELGVSKTTISLILNNKARQYRISEALEQTVRDFCKKKKYSINIHARRMHQEHVGNLGILLPPTHIFGIRNIFSDYNIAEILGGIAAAAYDAEYRFSVKIAKSKTITDLDFVAEWYKSREIDGLICHGFILDDAITERLLNVGVPLVAIGESPLKGVPTVGVDNYSGAYKLTEHLISRGYSELNFLGGVERSYVCQERYRGFAEALAKHEISHSRDEVEYADFREDLAYGWMKKRLQSGKKLEQALFCANDSMAIGVIQALKEAGKTVPGDMAVAGADNINLGWYITPALTTFHNCQVELGKNAFDLLYQVINREDGIDEHVKLDTDIIVRQST